MKATYFALVVLAFVACAWADEDEQLLPGICTLPMDAGFTCSFNQPSTRVTFNLNKRKCIQFTYNGCEGNANNFDNMVECQNVCKEAHVSDSSTRVFRRDSCVGPCEASVADQLGADNTTTQVPTTTLDTPANPPTAHASTTTAEIPPIPSSVPRICLHSMHTGFFCDDEKPSHRYGFSTSRRQCIPFKYYGCGGTVNNFDTIVECRKTCEMYLS